MQRFIIMGLPRSGTTYLMTLLNSHPEIFCSGEQFNPYSIIGINPSERVDSLHAVTARDQNPENFFEEFFGRHAAIGRQLIGFKFMIGHNIRILDHISRSPKIKLIYVYRNNKLAQISSLIKALETQEWATNRRTSNQPAHIRAGPRVISQRWHEYATYDRLFWPWFDALPHSRYSVEYCDMFAPDFKFKICKFLGVEAHSEMRSPLVKQNKNRIAERFASPEIISQYFTALNLYHWLNDEVTDLANK